MIDLTLDDFSVNTRIGLGISTTLAMHTPLILSSSSYLDYCPMYRLRTLSELVLAASAVFSTSRNPLGGTAVDYFLR